MFIRRNALKCTREQLIASLAAENVGVRETALQDAFALERPGDITRLSAFRDGWFFVQDLSAQLAAETLGAEPGDRVIDCCAAPGGKSFAAAISMENRGEVIAADLYPHKCALIEAGAKRLGITIIDTEEHDAKTVEQKYADDQADKVICDVPCSGLGVLRRKPEIKDRPLNNDGRDLSEIQYRILTASAAYVRPGGMLLYSTCTINRIENEDVTDRFINEHSDFAVKDQKLTLPCTGGPDGFYYCIMERCV